MAVNARVIPVPHETVAEVLREGAGYARWVVGTRKVTEVGAGFPSPGTALRVLVGPRPFSAPGRSQVLAYDPAGRLVLQAAAFLVGTARIELTYAPRGPGATHVRLDERPVERSRWQLLRPVVDVLMWVRNVETLRRLEKVAVQAQGADTTVGAGRPLIL